MEQYYFEFLHQKKIQTANKEFDVKRNIVKIIEIEKMRRNKRISLPDFISKLNNEFDEFISKP